ncbi:TIGR00266 family protein [Spirochaeta africana]|uniref:TIGR00266 family protein n=1 Tax=Spirochaeta africana (strain ATCC 700263 / DSM 8902 / Z-7692) TaxID=889378 RepID=H9UJY1_SPIAZ|nr:TIGR00266 family protein [Spirochaeta africana]AFG37824.1 TIGR00266 family protein [Spirochaeta africana DSM 8902]
MQYTILGSSMPLLECTLNAGEKVLSQPGAMKYMDYGVVMKTGIQGGISGFFKRTLSGESGFMSTFEAARSGQRIAFGHTYPGSIIPIDVAHSDIICQKRAFLACTEGVTFDIAIQRRLGSGFFGGEGFIMQRLGGTGTAFAEIDGETVEMQLEPGQKIQIETGAVAMFEATVDMNIEMVKGISNVFFGGEGLFLTTLTGPGKVWLQTMSVQRLASEIYPYLPASRKNS